MWRSSPRWANTQCASFAIKIWYAGRKRMTAAHQAHDLISDKTPQGSFYLRRPIPQWPLWGPFAAMQPLPGVSSFQAASGPQDLSERRVLAV